MVENTIVCINSLSSYTGLAALKKNVFELKYSSIKCEYYLHVSVRGVVGIGSQRNSELQ